jgi:hypothetical protein
VPYGAQHEAFRFIQQEELMKTELLLKLADMLEADAVKTDGLTFNMSMWAEPTNKVGVCGEKFLEGIQTIPISCGTSGCAMGLAALSGQFPGLGWRLWGKDNEFIPVFEDGSGREREGFEAAMDTFGLSYAQTIHLFDPSSYINTRGAAAENEVADRIRDMVAKHSPVIDDDESEY